MDNSTDFEAKVTKMINVSSHHGNIYVQKKPKVCTYHIVKRGKRGVGIKWIKSDKFSIKSYCVAEILIDTPCLISSPEPKAHR